MSAITGRPSRGLVLLGAVGALAGWALSAGPAAARVFVGPYPGYYAPYYAYPYPYPYPSPSPSPYPYPDPYSYQAPDYGPPGSALPPAAYTPETSVPPADYAPPRSASPAVRITYTNRPAFTNAAGQTCREFTTTRTVNGAPQQAYGTACRDANGQWRVAN